MIAQWGLAALMLKRAAENGGWTMSSESDFEPEYGYSVGGNPSVPEWVIPNFREMPGPFLIQQVSRYLENIIRAGGGWSGGWVDDDGALVLDSPTVITDRESALALGRERGERAVYCLHTGETITL